MIHLGDITKLHGEKMELVDCVCGGSPCQDLSVAGKRAGLAGARSGLFMEQIRVIKEMREYDRKQRSGKSAESLRADGLPEYIMPRISVWENVPGALSSNSGSDFAAVLEETIRVIEPEAPSIDVPKNGWPNAGAIVSETGNWSVAWRILDAQFWGVAQRRRRIALVADYGGLSAAKIVFECDTRGKSGQSVLSVGESLPGNSEPSGEQGQGSAGGTESCTYETVESVTYAFEGNGGRPSHFGDGYSQSDVSYTLNTIEQHGVDYATDIYERKTMHNDVSETLDASYYKGQGMRQGIEHESVGDRGKNWDGSNTCFTLTANNASGAQRMPDKENLSCILTAVGADCYNGALTGDKAVTLTEESCAVAGHSGPSVLSAVGIDAYNQSITGEASKPLTASATDSDHIPLVYTKCGLSTSSGGSTASDTLSSYHECSVSGTTTMVL